MLPRKLPDAESAKGWRVVRLDTHQDVKGRILSADADTGECVTELPDPYTQETTQVKIEAGANGLMIIRSLLLALMVGATLGACSQVQMFAAGDLANATALATAGGDVQGADCWQSLAPAVAASPDPPTDGIAVVAERTRLFTGAVQGPCASVILPPLLKALGKAAGPFGAALPF